jgi:hypothetical protein
MIGFIVGLLMILSIPTWMAGVFLIYVCKMNKIGFVLFFVGILLPVIGYCIGESNATMDTTYELVEITKMDVANGNNGMEYYISVSNENMYKVFEITESEYAKCNVGDVVNIEITASTDGVSNFVRYECRIISKEESAND